MTVNAELVRQYEWTLVKEFRHMQQLLRLAQLERAALINRLPQQLVEIAGEKQAVIEQLSAANQARRLAYAAVLHSSQVPEAGCAGLLEGIEVIGWQERQISRGNGLLAAAASAASALQPAWLLTGALGAPSPAAPLLANPPEVSK